ncbi:MAG: carboxypeptidase regulatory-like domain-containing protein [Planctomycetes bacterium]|nr:carboxypeptidase regulatory-like domain-containing protein [Planctomycetota bacterium]
MPKIWNAHRFGLFTNSQGEASVVLPPGSYVLTDVDKYGKYRKNFLNREFVASAGQVESIVVEMELLPIISGTVYDPEGKVVSGAELLTFPSTFYMSEPQFGCESQADGKFRFFWDADKAYEDKERRKYEIYLSVMHERRNLAVLLPLRQATMENIDIVLSPTGSITGIITDSAGDPVEDVEITVRRKRQSEPIGRGYGTGSSTNRNSGMVITVKTGFKVCQTDDLGRYELKGMPPLPESYQYRLHIQNCDEVIIVESEDFVAGEVLVKDVVMKR